MNGRFLPQADEELREAARYYEAQATELGVAFIGEVHRGLGVILDFPEIGRPLDEEFRLFVLRRFPYNLIYIIEGDEVVVAAVAHQKRRPFYWDHTTRP